MASQAYPNVYLEGVEASENTWKAWKHPKTRVKNLIKCGIKPYWAHMWGNASKGCWAVAGAFMQNAATTQLLRRAGYPCLLDYYVQMHKM